MGTTRLRRLQIAPHSARQPFRHAKAVAGILLYTAGVLLCVAGCSWPDSHDGPDTSTAIPLVGDFVLIGDSTILLATDEGKLMKSDNGGCSWREVNGAGCPRPGFKLVFWNMMNGEGESVWTSWWELYLPGFDVMHRSGLGVSHDGGETFRIFDHDELQFGLLRSEWEDESEEAAEEIAAEEDDLSGVPLGSMTMWDTSVPV